MAPTHPSPTATTVDVSFPVSGMTCASCVNRVEKAIAKVPGVEGAAVNLATERATVNYDPRQTTAGDIAAAVARAGYGVTELPRSLLSRLNLLHRRQGMGTAPMMLHSEMQQKPFFL